MGTDRSGPPEPCDCGKGTGEPLRESRVRKCGATDAPRGLPSNPLLSRLCIGSSDRQVGESLRHLTGSRDHGDKGQLRPRLPWLLWLQNQCPLEENDRRGTVACPKALLPSAAASCGNVMPYQAAGPPLGLGAPRDQVLVGPEETGPAAPSSPATSESASLLPPRTPRTWGLREAQAVLRRRLAQRTAKAAADDGSESKCPGAVRARTTEEVQAGRLVEHVLCTAPLAVV